VGTDTTPLSKTDFSQRARLDNDLNMNDKNYHKLKIQLSQQVIVIAPKYVLLDYLLIQETG
jgi:hypothetical protein